MPLVRKQEQIANAMRLNDSGKTAGWITRALTYEDELQAGTSHGTAHVAVSAQRGADRRVGAACDPLGTQISLQVAPAARAGGRCPERECSRLFDVADQQARG
jgi:hypothetical protein